MLSIKTSVKGKLLQRPISKTGPTVVFFGVIKQVLSLVEAGFQSNVLSSHGFKRLYIILFVQLDAQLDAFKYKYDSLRIFP